MSPKCEPIMDMTNAMRTSIATPPFGIVAMAVITLDIIPRFDILSNSFFLALEALLFLALFCMRRRTKDKAPNRGEREKAMTNIENRNEVMKIVHTMKADAEEVNQKIREAAALFKAVQYSVSECVLDEDETDNCLLGFSFLMDSLLDLSDGCYSNSANPVSDVDLLLFPDEESGVEQ